MIQPRMVRRENVPSEDLDPAQVELIPIPCGHVVGTKFGARNRRLVLIPSDQRVSSGRDRRRSGDLTLFRSELWEMMPTPSNEASELHLGRGTR